jgi:hypothetical protein
MSSKVALGSSTTSCRWPCGAQRRQEAVVIFLRLVALAVRVRSRVSR